MSFSADAAGDYLRYSDGLEEIDPKENQTFAEINELMAKGADTVREKYGCPSASLTRRRTVPSTAN